MSPEESRPADNRAAWTSSGSSTVTSTVPDFDVRRAALLLDKLTANVAAVLGAEQLGYMHGWADGRWAGLDEAARRLRAAQHDLSRAADWRALAADPSHAGLARLRQPSDEPCGGRCGTCSRCIRATWVRRTGGDLPGASPVDEGAA